VLALIILVFIGAPLFTIIGLLPSTGFYVEGRRHRSGYVEHIRLASQPRTLFAGDSSFYLCWIFLAKAKLPKRIIAFAQSGLLEDCRRPCNCGAGQLCGLLQRYAVFGSNHWWSRRLVIPILSQEGSQGKIRSRS